MKLITSPHSIELPQSELVLAGQLSEENSQLGVSEMATIETDHLQPEDGPGQDPRWDRAEVDVVHVELPESQTAPGPCYAAQQSCHLLSSHSSPGQAESLEPEEAGDEADWLQQGEVEMAQPQLPQPQSGRLAGGQRGQQEAELVRGESGGDEVQTLQPGHHSPAHQLRSHLAQVPAQLQLGQVTTTSITSSEPLEEGVDLVRGEEGVGEPAAADQPEPGAGEDILEVVPVQPDEAPGPEGGDLHH